MSTPRLPAATSRGGASPAFQPSTNWPMSIKRTPNLSATLALLPTWFVA
ncbi:sugar ABC transporter permease, partial [Rhizobium ruizarguesonis]